MRDLRASFSRFAHEDGPLIDCPQRPKSAFIGRVDYSGIAESMRITLRSDLFALHGGDVARDAPHGSHSSNRRMNRRSTL
jgi:hypothetical protein